MYLPVPSISFMTWGLTSTSLTPLSSIRLRQLSGSSPYHHFQSDCHSNAFLNSIPQKSIHGHSSIQRLHIPSIHPCHEIVVLLLCIGAGVRGALYTLTDRSDCLLLASARFSQSWDGIRCIIIAMGSVFSIVPGGASRIDMG